MESTTVSRESPPEHEARCRQMGITGERIRQIQNIALNKLRSDPRLMKAAA